MGKGRGSIWYTWTQKEKLWWDLHWLPFWFHQAFKRKNSCLYWTRMKGLRRRQVYSYQNNFVRKINDGWINIHIEYIVEVRRSDLFIPINTHVWIILFLYTCNIYRERICIRNYSLSWNGHWLNEKIRDPVRDIQQQSVRNIDEIPLSQYIWKRKKECSNFLESINE